MTIIAWHSTLDELKLKNRLKVLLNGILCSTSLVVALKFLMLYIETVFGYASSNERAIGAGMIASLVTAIITARECSLSIDQLAAIIDMKIKANCNDLPANVETKEEIEKHIELLAAQHRQNQTALNRAARFAK